MIVECIQIQSPAYPGELVSSHPAIKISNEYLLIGISVHFERPPSFWIIDEYGMPSIWPATMFSVRDGRVPDGWVVHRRQYGIDLGPAPTVEPGFWERYWGDEEEALLVVRRIIEQGG